MSASQHDADRLLEHEYDGIQEYDNPIPAWWHWIFAGSIVFSVLYFAFWHFAPQAWTNEQAWEMRQVAEYQRIFGQLGELKPDEPTILAMMNDEQMLAVARGIFVGNCAACHGKDGGGINGVNLTDDHYKNVRALPDIFTVITKGAANGAMPAWENRLGENERILLAAYVANLRGTTPAAGRAPEGNLIAPWPTPQAE